MKYTLSLFALFVSHFFNPIYSQDKTRGQEIVAEFKISDASENGADITPTILDQRAKLVIYKDVQNNNALCLSNFWQKNNTQSYGPIYGMETKHIPEDDKNYEADIFFFQWRYINTYDTKKGTAKVELLKIYKPQGIYFELKIIPENLDILIYKGFMEGSLDLTVYEKKK
jgi:hypothetical protein